MAAPIPLLLLAPPAASGSSLFGLYDTLSAAGRDWETLVTSDPVAPLFDVMLVGTAQNRNIGTEGFHVAADTTLEHAPGAGIIVVPGLALSPYDRLDRADHPAIDWLRNRAAAGARVVSACTGAVYLAEAGLLSGEEITTHWAFGDLFRRHYPDVRLRLDRGLCFADASQGVVTSGGTTGWQELALFLITHYGGASRAAKTAKVWLMADRGELQSPFASALRASPHDDAIIADAQVWIAMNYSDPNPVQRMTVASGLPGTTFARRFRQATGQSPQDYVQSLRIEEARQMLETTDHPVAEIAEEVGYRDTASFRRLFKRRTGISPAEHRRMFGASRFERYC